MIDKEKQIKKITEIIEVYSDINQSYYDGEWQLTDVYSGLAKTLYNKGIRVVNKDSIVLSKEEHERLSSSHDIVFCDNKDCPNILLCMCCEISECPKNIPEYNEKLSVNKHKLDLFQKLYKEREKTDSWKDRCNLLQEELKQTKKETAERDFNTIIKALEIKKASIITHYGVKESVGADVAIRTVKELAKQLGVEIEEVK